MAKNDVYDLIGIGFGPANLALAVALEEEAGDLSTLFLEAKPRPVWHPGMLLEDSLIQISVLKDLATIRNPQSRFTFLNYLKVKGRLFEFLNLRDLFPTRIEFNDYLGWVAGELASRVRYGREVVSIEPVEEEGEVRLVEVVSRDVATGEESSCLARNVVLATGGVPCLPDGITLQKGGRAFHANESMIRLKNDYPDKSAPYRFVVVGSGQSGAELFHYLMTQYPNADVTAAIRRFSYKPVDDSDFTNEIFFPNMVDLVYSLPEEKRKMILDHCRDVNYAVVDTSLIRRIYKCLYQEKVLGRDRARIRTFMNLEEVMETGDKVIARFQNVLRDETVTLEADGMVICSGYAWHRDHPLLSQLRPWLKRGESGLYRMERDYHVITEPGFAPLVFLQGFSEETYGASEPVLSLLPARAENILRSIQSSRQTQAVGNVAR